VEAQLKKKRRLRANGARQNSGNIDSDDIGGCGQVSEVDEAERDEIARKITDSSSNNTLSRDRAMITTYFRNIRSNLIVLLKVFHCILLFLY